MKYYDVDINKKYKVLSLDKANSCREKNLEKIGIMLSKIETFKKFSLKMNKKNLKDWTPEKQKALLDMLERMIYRQQRISDADISMFTEICILVLENCECAYHYYDTMKNMIWLYIEEADYNGEHNN